MPMGTNLLKDAKTPVFAREREFYLLPYDMAV